MLAVAQAFMVPAAGRLPALQARVTHRSAPVGQQALAMPSSTRRRELLKMDVDPAVIGGVIAGVVGISLGVGAMIFTEKQTVRREERKAADRAKAARAQRAAAAAAASAAEGGAQGGAQGQQRPDGEEGDDGW